MKEILNSRVRMERFTDHSPIISQSSWGKTLILTDGENVSLKMISGEKVYFHASNIPRLKCFLDSAGFLFLWLGISIGQFIMPILSKRSPENLWPYGFHNLYPHLLKKRKMYWKLNSDKTKLKYRLWSRLYLHWWPLLWIGLPNCCISPIMK